jgi:LacI family transcriptional regulator
MVAGNFSMSDRSLHRWHGYKQCLNKHGIPYAKELLVQTEYSLSGGKNSTRQLLELKDRPTALFCSNDYLALGAMKGARAFGLELPRDLSIVGFDDIQITSYITPELTTVYQPAYDMGRHGAQLLFELMDKRPLKAVQMMLKTSLIIRDSTTTCRRV